MLLHERSTAAATVDRMEEAERVLERLRRIEALERGQASAQELLAELRGLVGEAEAWVRLEGDERARCAVGKLREGAEGMT
jgi:hypothetical protein